MMTTRKKQSHVRRILRLDEKIKALRTAKDALTSELIEAVPVGEAITVDAKQYGVLDPFVKGFRVWRPACVSRYEFGEIKPLPTRPRKLEPEQVEKVEQALETAEALA